MNSMKDFEHIWAQMIVKSEYKLAKIQALRLEIESFIASPDFKLLEVENQDSLQIVFKEVWAKEREIDSKPSELQLSPGPANKLDSENIRMASQTSIPKNSEVEKIMDEAERLFYSGQYAKAIKMYDRVLEIEPNWERAREHHNESEKYLTEGRIPSQALPPEVAILFGKALSATRVEHYQAALDFINHAKMILAEQGIRKWVEGQEFEVQLHDFIVAEEVATEGIKLFNQGQIDEAIDRIEMVLHITPLPKYQDLAEKYKVFKYRTQQISNYLISSNVSTSTGLFMVLDDMEKIKEDFGKNPVIHTLTEKIEFLKPSLINSIRQEIIRSLSDAEISQTIDSATSYLKKAKIIVDKSGEYDLTKEIYDIYIKDVMRKSATLESFQGDLEQAEQFSKIKSSQGIAKKIITELYKKYPNDPSILKVQESLGVKIAQSYDPNPPPDDIDSIILKAKELFSLQKIDQAIEFLDYQYKILGVSRLRDLSTEYKEIKRVIANLSNIIYSGNVTELIETFKTIVALRDKYGDLPIPEHLLAKLNYQLLIYLIDSKNGEDEQSTAVSQNIVIQGLLGEQTSISFHEYYRVLNGMILKDPLNKRLQILLAWVKHEIDLNDKQTRYRVERNRSIDSFRGQAKVWFVLSIATAIAFLALAIYIILLSTQQEDVWVRLSSLFSILPVFISKLVYDQSLAANRRADEMFEKLMNEDSHNTELDRLDERDIRSIVFQEKSKSAKQKKSDSNKDIPKS